MSLRWKTRRVEVGVSSGQYNRMGLSTRSFLLLLGRDGDVRHVVDEEPVVGHVVGQVGVGPVGAPQHAVRELLHGAAREGHDVDVGVALPSTAAGPVTVSRSGQLTLTHTSLRSTNRRKRLNSGPSTGLVTSGRPMWSTTSGTGSETEEALQLGQVGGLEVEDDVPAERGDPFAIVASSSVGAASTRRLTKLNRTPRTPASSSSRSSVSVTSGRTVAIPAGPAAGGADGVDHRPVVGAVAGGLDDDVAADSEVVAQREELLLARVAGRVLALGREGELVARPEDVAVGVDRAGRQRERGRGRTRMPVQPPAGLGKGQAHSPPWSPIRCTESRWRQTCTQDGSQDC